MAIGHVDDIKSAGDKEFEKSWDTQFCKRVKFSDEGYRIGEKE